MTAMRSSLTGVHVGTSGWSYPSWKPGFYPAGTASKEFLAYYGQRFSTVELNTTGYRLPAEEQFRRWAKQTPAGFRFAPKLAGNRPRLLQDFASRVRELGDRLGPVRLQLIRARDEGMVELILGSVDSEDRVEARVPLGFVRDVRGVVPVVVVQSGDGDADVRTDSRAADGEAILRAVSWTARSAREAARILVALRRVVRKEAVTEE